MPSEKEKVDQVQEERDQAARERAEADRLAAVERGDLADPSGPPSINEPPGSDVVARSPPPAPRDDDKTDEKNKSER